MPQIKPFTVPATEVSQRSVEDVGQKASRPGSAGSNPPSTKQSYTVPLAGATQVIGRMTVAIGNPAGLYGVVPGQVVANAGGFPSSINVEAPAPPPIPETGTVPTMNPVETPRVAADERIVNNAPPTLSVNLTERSINEAYGGKPLAPNVVARDGGQVVTNARPEGPADEVASGTNPVDSGPIVDPVPPAITPPVSQPGYPGN